MAEILQKVFEWLGPEYAIAKALAICSTILVAFKVFHQLKPIVQRRARLVLRSWRVANLDEVSKRLVANDQKYLGALLEYVRSKRWDPQLYVKPTLGLKEHRLEPIFPILVLLDTVAARQSSPDASPLERKETVHTSRVRNLLGSLKHLKSIVLLGDPGSGKTTCLLQLAAEVANRSLYSGDLRPTLPLFLPLNEFTEPLDASDPQNTVLAFIVAQIEQQTLSIRAGDVSARLSALIRDGRLLFLFDALDEMPRDNYYDRFRALNRFVKACSTFNNRNLFVFSCRKLDYVDDPTFQAQQVLVSPFSPRQVRQFIKRYLPVDTSTTLNLLTSSSDLAGISRSPFFLSLFTACIKANVSPGQSWDVLVRNFIETALDGVRERRGYNTAEWVVWQSSTVRWLTKLAFVLVESRATGTKAEQVMVAESLLMAHVETQVIEIAVDAGILRRLGHSGALRFEHHRLQEYFASIRLAELFDSEQADAYTYLDDIWWREVIFMTAGLMNHPEKLINDILESADQVAFTSFSDVRSDFSRVMIAIACYRPAFLKLSRNTRQRLAVYLVQFLRYGNILQQVRSLRVLPAFADRPDVIIEARRLFYSPSKWVRQTALSVVAETAALQSAARGQIRERMGGIVKNNEMLVRGIQDFPELFRHRSTRWLAPAYAASIVVGLIRASWLWILFAAGVFLAERPKVVVGDYLSKIGAPLGWYWIFKFVSKRGYGQTRWNITDSLNRFTVFWLCFQIVMLAVSGVLEMISGRANATHRSFNIGEFLTTCISLLFLYLTARAVIGIYLNWRIEHLRKINWREFEPADSSEGRSKQARRLLSLAEQESIPVLREQLIDAVRRFLPVNRDVLVAIEEFCEMEANVDIRTKAFQVYEQIELGLDREGARKQVGGV